MPKPADRRFLDTDGLKEIAAPIENALFESDINSRAGGGSGPKGDLPMPAQDGLNLPGIDFKSERLSLASGRESSPPPTEIRIPSAAKAPPRASTTAPLPPLFKPQPVDPKKLEQIAKGSKETVVAAIPFRGKVVPQADEFPEPPTAEDAAEESGKPQGRGAGDGEIPIFLTLPTRGDLFVPKGVPQVVAIKTEEAPRPRPNLTQVPNTPKRPSVEIIQPEAAPLAMLPRPTPVVAPKAQPPPRPEERRVDVAKLTPPTPRPEPGAKYTPNREKKQVAGAISNRPDEAGVDSVATPWGRFNKKVKSMIGSRWHYYTKSQMDRLTPGSVWVTFTLDASGRVGTVRIEENTSNSALAELCIRAIRESEFSSVPEEARDRLVDGVLQIPFTFTIY
jgi:TonB family protein